MRINDALYSIRKPFTFFVFSVCLFSLTNAQSLTPDQFIDDLNHFKKELPQRHKNLYAKISEADFLRKVDAIAQKANTLNNESFEIELYQLIKEIGDEHTRLEPAYKTIYPVSFDFFKEGIFVTGTNAENAGLLYKQLNGVNTKSTKDILDLVKTIVKDDNASYFDVYFQQFINNPRVLKGLTITPDDLKATFLLDQQKAILSAVSKEAYKPAVKPDLLRFKRSENYWFELINNGKTLYFNYQECREEEDKPFADFTNELFALVEKAKPEKIIIDLRNNMGGNSGIIHPFMEKLKKSHLNKKGKLFVLIGKSTFSSALMNAVELKRNYHSILVGESTSGTVNHYGEVRGFTLPNSQLVVGYSTRFWEVWKGYDGPLRPDVKVEYSIHNFRKNIDEGIAYILKQP
ncbi:S41 family peptidase [Gynurincola endophyticus]|uniref:S41 family peptidase n=1 Tax=Gynurincola endophyticus TaxID=2479004 RepID=UPI000F8ECDFC|nr:S41 family peptidase [Gynurincola endophyticus]